MGVLVALTSQMPWGSSIITGVRLISANDDKLVVSLSPPPPLGGGIEW